MSWVFVSGGGVWWGFEDGNRIEFVPLQKRPQRASPRLPPHEETRKEVSAAQKRAPPATLAPWPWTFSFQNCKEYTHCLWVTQCMVFCYISPWTKTQALLTSKALQSDISSRVLTKEHKTSASCTWIVWVVLFCSVVHPFIHLVSHSVSVLFIELFLVTVCVFMYNCKHISNLVKCSLLRYYVWGRNLDDFFIWSASYHKINYDIIDPFPAGLKCCSLSYTNGWTKLCLSLEL